MLNFIQGGLRHCSKSYQVSFGIDGGLLQLLDSPVIFLLLLFNRLSHDLRGFEPRTGRTGLTRPGWLTSEQAWIEDLAGKERMITMTPWTTDNCSSLKATFQL